MDASITIVDEAETADEPISQTNSEAISEDDLDETISDADSDGFLPLEAMPLVCVRGSPKEITNDGIFYEGLDICAKVRNMGYSMTRRPKTVAHYRVPKLESIEEEDEERSIDHKFAGLSPM